ncbi:COG3014 family protein [Halodesulfovibrio marinisediminis]|uniref:Tetratricopeptide repeat-containing protein n=1 Tax=Halodesulfovibrio marinisediminis DSM 17456 TaxID=1121457 RepID=A0A1N6I2N0_9BACT|nr:hypothetical protein [Halodesulfovibrio marinisediminis]SIO26276.1 hypothetical protein SAMN02745161_2366 [Halodesulfovibrio marinisediminis DSM 17456]
MNRLLFLLLATVTVLSGCATMQQQDQHALLNPYYLGDSTTTSTILDTEFDHALPFLLDASMIRFNQGRFEDAYTLLNESEAEVKDDETEGDIYAASKVVGEILFNREFMDYEPRTSDTVLINMYKGYSLLALNKSDKARVEFNRTLDRQRRAVEKYKEEIKELQEEAKEQRRKQEEQIAFRKNDDEPVLDLLRIQDTAKKTVYESMPEVSHWTGYGDFVNPYATYLSGLFFCANGEMESDYSKCNTMLKRVQGMVPTNSYLKQDAAMSNAFERGTKSSKYRRPTVWVLFENGLAPEVDELRFDIPLFLAGESTGVSMISFAMPQLKTRNAALPFIQVKSGSRQYTSKTLCSFDRVMQAEYKAHLTSTITKAVASTATKTFLQYLAQAKGGQLAGIASGLFTSAITRADTRSWLSLPKDVQMIRVPKPENKTLVIEAPNGATLATVELPDTKYSIVHVRMPQKNSIPYIVTVPLGN